MGERRRGDAFEFGIWKSAFVISARRHGRDAGEEEGE
jgi:hypothetical protein